MASTPPLERSTHSPPPLQRIAELRQVMKSSLNTPLFPTTSPRRLAHRWPRPRLLRYHRPLLLVLGGLVFPVNGERAPERERATKGCLGRGEVYCNNTPPKKCNQHCRKEPRRTHTKVNWATANLRESNSHILLLAVNKVQEEQTGR